MSTSETDGDVIAVDGPGNNNTDGIVDVPAVRFQCGISRVVEVQREINVGRRWSNYLVLRLASIKTKGACESRCADTQSGQEFFSIHA